MALHNYNINLAQLLLKFLNAQDPMHEIVSILP
jgi:hypothetical protein